MDSERRPVDYSYVITEGTFLISNWGNNLIADTAPVQSTGSAAA